MIIILLIIILVLIGWLHKFIIEQFNELNRAIWEMTCRLNEHERKLGREDKNVEDCK